MHTCFYGDTSSYTFHLALFNCTCKWLVGITAVSAITAVLKEYGNVKTTSSYAIENFHILLVVFFAKPHTACVCVELIQDTFCAVPYFIDIYCREVKVFFCLTIAFLRKFRTFLLSVIWEHSFKLHGKYISRRKSKSMVAISQHIHFIFVLVPQSFS